MWIWDWVGQRFLIGGAAGIMEDSLALRETVDINVVVVLWILEVDDGLWWPS